MTIEQQIKIHERKLRIAKNSRDWLEKRTDKNIAQPTRQTYLYYIALCDIAIHEAHISLKTPLLNKKIIYKRK